MGKKVEIEIFSVEDELPEQGFVIGWNQYAEEWCIAAYYPTQGQWRGEDAEPFEHEDEISHWFEFPAV